jgi:hypothetical protein
LDFRLCSRSIRSTAELCEKSGWHYWAGLEFDKLRDTGGIKRNADALHREGIEKHDNGKFLDEADLRHRIGDIQSETRALYMAGEYTEAAWRMYAQGTPGPEGLKFIRMCIDRCIESRQYARAEGLLMMLGDHEKATAVHDDGSAAAARAAERPEMMVQRDGPAGSYPDYKEYQVAEEK